MTDPRDAVYRQAARWHEAAEAGLGAAQEAELARWRAAAPAHERAYCAVVALACRTRDGDGLEDLSDLRQAALRRLSQGPQRALRRGVAMGAVAALAVAGSGWWLWPAGRPAQAAYRTAVGERMTLDASDGSQIMLDTDSLVRLTFDAGHRRVVLERGRAFFDVAHDAHRPFSVESGGRAVVAHGTAFEVRRTAQGMSVALARGAVSVESAGAPPVALRPGDLFDARDATTSLTHHMDVAGLTAWRSGLLHFADAPLATVIGEVNRYAATPLRPADAATAAIRISGTLDPRDRDEVLAMLHAGFGVAARADRDAIVLHGPPPAPRPARARPGDLAPEIPVAAK